MMKSATVAIAIALLATSGAYADPENNNRGGSKQYELVDGHPQYQRSYQVGLDGEGED